MSHHDLSAALQDTRFHHRRLRLLEIDFRSLKSLRYDVQIRTYGDTSYLCKLSSE